MTGTTLNRQCPDRKNWYLFVFYIMNYFVLSRSFVGCYILVCDVNQFVVWFIGIPMLVG